MANSFALYRLEQVSRALDILTETMERRVPPDDAVDSAVVSLRLEVTLLRSQLIKESKEH